MKIKTCPKCNAKMFLDYYDIVWEQEDGSFLMDVFDAWLCENKCGYYEKATEEDSNGEE